MGQNPLAVLAAMLGGGFTGYGQDQEKRIDNARQNRLVGLEFDKLKQGQEEFRANHQLANDRLGLDSELGRGGLEVQRGGLDLNNREFGHKQQFDWASLNQDDRQKMADRSTQLRIAEMNYNGQNNPNVADQRERDQQGAAYLGQVSPSNRTPEQQQMLNQIGNYMGANPGTSANTAAFNVARGIQYPPTLGGMQRADNPLNGRAGARPYVAGGTPPAQQGAGGPPPAPQTKPRTAAEWDAELDRLIDAGENEANILAKLGPRPLQ